MPKMANFLYENRRGSPTLTLLNVTHVLNVINVLNVLDVVTMPKHALLVWEAIFLFCPYLFFFLSFFLFLSAPQRQSASAVKGRPCSYGRAY